MYDCNLESFIEIYEHAICPSRQFCLSFSFSPSKYSILFLYFWYRSFRCECNAVDKVNEKLMNWKKCVVVVCDED